VEFNQVALAVIRDDPIALPSPVLGEIFYGLFREGRRRPEFVNQALWLKSLIDDSIVTVLSLNADAAILAAEVRSRVPFPGRRGAGAQRSRAEDRVAWYADILIAATTFVHGRDLVTRNVRDFLRLAAAIPVDNPADALGVAEPDFGEGG